MLISHGSKVIFIHIQKTGGSSIEAALSAAVSEPLLQLPDLPAGRDPAKRRHLFASDLQPLFSDYEWRTYFKFAFVRNPWSRLVSWYRMCVERPSNYFMWFVKDRAKTFDEFLALTHGVARKTTVNQVDYICDSIGNRLVDFVGRYENIETDFAEVSRRLALNMHLPHINRGRPVDYRAYYTQGTRRLVEERFRRDIKAFDYDFESGLLRSDSAGS